MPSSPHVSEPHTLSRAPFQHLCPGPANPRALGASAAGGSDLGEEAGDSGGMARVLPRVAAIPSSPSSPQSHFPDAQPEASAVPCQDSPEPLNWLVLSPPFLRASLPSDCMSCHLSPRAPSPHLACPVMLQIQPHPHHLSPRGPPGLPPSPTRPSQCCCDSLSLAGLLWLKGPFLGSFWPPLYPPTPHPTPPVGLR